MIKLCIGNLSSLLPSLASSWIEEENNPSYSSFNSRYDDYDDEYYGELFRGACDAMVGSWWNDYPRDDDDDEYDYSFYRKGKKGDSSKKFKDLSEDYDGELVLSTILEDESQWDAVVEKYSTDEKVLNEINKVLSVVELPYGVPSKKKRPRHKSKNQLVMSSDMFGTIQENDKKFEDDWRREIRESISPMDILHTIYFYPDGRDESKREVFSSISEFKTYCAENMILIDSDMESDLDFYSPCHCSLDEYSKDRGYKELRVARSYGELYYDLYGEELYSEECSFTC